MRYLTTAPLLLLLFAGCKLGPDYERPHLDEPQSLLGDTASGDLDQLADWWQKLGDPVLAELVTHGLTNSLTVQSGLQRIRQVRAQLAQSSAGLWPSLTGGASYSPGKKYGELSGAGYNATGVPSDGSWGGTFAGGFDATWELDIFGGTRREIEAREAEVAAAHFSQRDIKVSLSAEIATAYLNVRMLQDVLAVTHANLTAQTQSADITRKRHEAQSASGLDLANAEAQVFATTAQIPALEASLADMILYLEALLGELPNTRKEHLMDTASFPQLPEALPTMLPNELLRRRPDVHQAEAALVAATARIGAAEAELYPHFALIGAIGASMPTPMHQWSAFTETLRIGPRVSWNIFSAGRVRAQVEERKALAEQAALAYRQTVLTAYREAESAWQGYNQESLRSDALGRSVEASQRAVRIARDLYANGYSDYMEVLIAERTLLTAQDALARHRALLAQKLIALYKALGGSLE
ncbi:MAG: efflux transporter outer membrane subunit [Kiritimatiellaeota bacterium]|nr:efflux transporter outer membrane subunit [Kiritimatiellota bacterium]